MNSVSKAVIPIIIPAYEPDAAFVSFCESLPREKRMPLVVVDDGSGKEYEEIFKALEGLPDCTVLRHGVNLGKGRALKDAFNYVLVNYPETAGVVTADCDGQHSFQDIRKCMSVLEENPHDLILGCRVFDGEDVPWKSRMGNKITRHVFSCLCGLKVSDTQTGLRGIPVDFLRRILSTKGERFEYETNMLLECGQGTGIREVAIETLYDSKEEHRTHFDPLRDSVRIYKIILAYSLPELFAVVTDFMVFAAAVSCWQNIWSATAAARVCSVLVYFAGGRKTFKLKGNRAGGFVRHVVPVLVLAIVSAVLVSTVLKLFSFHVLMVKAAVEFCLIILLSVYRKCTNFPGSNGG